MNHWILTIMGFSAALTLNLAWLFVSKQRAVEKSPRRILSISLRLMIIFGLIHFCFRNLTWQNQAVFLPVFIAIFHISPLLFRYPTSGYVSDGLMLAIYFIQQWVLGWPDRDLFIPPNPPKSGPPLRTEMSHLIGQTAVVETSLRPVGRILIGEQHYEAASEYGYVEKGTMVQITGASDFNLIVRPDTFMEIQDRVNTLGEKARLK